MKKISITLMTLSIVSGLGLSMPAFAQAEHNRVNENVAVMLPPPKTIEMVFVLDTTGSMGGLLEGAKTKIWRIVNDVMQLKNIRTRFGRHFGVKRNYLPSRAVIVNYEIVNR